MPKFQAHAPAYKAELEHGAAPIGAIYFDENRIGAEIRMTGNESFFGILLHNAVAAVTRQHFYLAAAREVPKVHTAFHLRAYDVVVNPLVQVSVRHLRCECLVQNNQALVKKIGKPILCV